MKVDANESSDGVWILLKPGHTDVPVLQRGEELVVREVALAPRVAREHHARWVPRIDLRPERNRAHVY